MCAPVRAAGVRAVPGMCVCDVERHGGGSFSHFSSLEAEFILNNSTNDSFRFVCVCSFFFVLFLQKNTSEPMSGRERVVFAYVTHVVV